MDMSVYTLEELEHITSEYTLRNQVSRSPASLSLHTTLLTCIAAESSSIFIFLPRIPSPWLSPS